MSDLDDLLAARERLWWEHPIISETAVLPTLPMQDVIVKVLALKRKGRGSLAVKADPLKGKTTCIRRLELTLKEHVPGCGVLVFEAVEDNQAAEGRLLHQILTTIGYSHRIDRELAGKRDQVNRALLAWSGPAKHLFLLIDEAQELCNNEFAWLKAVINGLNRSGVKVTTVLFGQKELKQKRDELFNLGRSDLGVRFMKELHEFLGCRNAVDLRAILQALDTKSEYPTGSGWSYTKFLLPQSFSGGFRSELMADVIWASIEAAVPPASRRGGLAMDFIAAILANFFMQNKDQDSVKFAVSKDMADSAVKAALLG